MAQLNPFKCRMCGRPLGYKPRDAIYCCATCRVRANRLLQGITRLAADDAALGIISVTGPSVAGEQGVEE